MNSSRQSPWRGLLLIISVAGLPLAFRTWGLSGSAVPVDRPVCAAGDPLVTLLQEASRSPQSPNPPGAAEIPAAAEPADRQSPTGSVRGVVRFRGESPRAAVANLAGKRPPLLQIEAETGGLGQTVVFLPAGSRWPQPPKAAQETTRDLQGKPLPEEGQPRKQKRGPAVDVQATMDQQDHEFTPRVVAIRTGAAVRFTNSDVANHNVHGHGLDSKNQFNVFTGGGASHLQRFRAEKGQCPVRIGCDIHPWMQGWVYVFEHPWFAITNAAGQFELREIPPGRHTLAIRQPDSRLEATREVEVTADEVTEVTIDLAPADLPGESGRE